MNSSTVSAEHQSLHRAGRRRFGNWRKALVAAGLDPDEYQGRGGQ